MWEAEATLRRCPGRLRPNVALSASVLARRLHSPLDQARRRPPRPLAELRVVQRHPVPVRLSCGGLHLPLFGPPNVDKFKANRDAPGLRKALEYQNHWRVRPGRRRGSGPDWRWQRRCVLVTALRDDTSSVRQAAAEALWPDRRCQRSRASHRRPQDGEFGCAPRCCRRSGPDRRRQSSRGPLGCSQDASWSVREGVAEALGHIPDPRAAESLSAA